MRSTWGMGLAAGLVLAGCAAEAPEDSAAQREADAAAVQEILAANTPPPMEIALMPMDYADFEREGLLGASCAFVIDDEVFALAMPDIGALKYYGNVERFAPDAGSAEGPFDTRAKYDGRELSFRLAVSGTQERTGDELWSQPAQLSVHDGYDRIVYEAAGSAECGA